MGGNQVQCRDREVRYNSLDQELLNGIKEPLLRSTVLSLDNRDQHNLLLYTELNLIVCIIVNYSVSLFHKIYIRYFNLDQKQQVLLTFIVYSISRNFKCTVYLGNYDYGVHIFNSDLATTTIQKCTHFQCSCGLYCVCFVAFGNMSGGKEFSGDIAGCLSSAQGKLVLLVVSMLELTLSTVDNP